MWHDAQASAGAASWSAKDCQTCHETALGPAFAKSKQSIAAAERGYKEINLRALRILKPGGCLLTCSCSYHVHEDHFEAILAEAAVDAGATVTVVEKRRQARDHPVLLGVPETHYLKCLVVRKLA